MSGGFPMSSAPAGPVGLSSAEARLRMDRDGPNEQAVSRPRSVLLLAREVALDPMFVLLVACGAIYLVLGDRQEALMLLGFVVVVMGISFTQQQRSERSLEALRDLSSPRALVDRDGAPRRIPARELVVGDAVLLVEGDRVPADVRLTETSNFAVDESLLTCESMPVAKHAATLAPPVPATDTGPAGNDPALAYAGTLVTRGTARGCVVAVGGRSALGRIGQ